MSCFNCSGATWYSARRASYPLWIDVAVVNAAHALVPVPSRTNDDPVATLSRTVAPWTVRVTTRSGTTRRSSVNERGMHSGRGGVVDSLGHTQLPKPAGSASGQRVP